MKKFTLKYITGKDNITVSERLKTNAIAEIGRYDASLSVDKELVNSALHILLQKREAETSSKIEGTKVTFQELLMSDVAPDTSTKKTQKTEIDEVRGLEQAIQKANDQTSKNIPFSNKMIKMMHKEFMQHAVVEQGTPGKYRTFGVTVGEYIPPLPKKLTTLMESFERYIQSQEDTVNPLVRVAIAHAYFEVLHPFGDGNGRIGRLLIPFLIHEYGITQSPSFFLSPHFEKNRKAYYQGLANLGEKGGWDAWVTYFLTVSEEHAKNLNKKGKALFDLYKNPEFLALSTSNSQAIKNFIFQSPTFTIPALARYLKENNLGTTKNLSGKLDVVIEQGDMEIFKIGKGRTPTWYTCKKIIEIIQS